MTSHALPARLSLLSLLVLAACGGSGDDAQTAGVASSGTQTVVEATTDAPAPTAAEIAQERATLLASQHPEGEPFEVAHAGHSEPETAVIKGDMAFLGDIAIGEVRGNQIVRGEREVIASVGPAAEGSGRVKALGSGIINSPQQRWPNGVIPYVIDGGATQATRAAFEAAKRDYDAKTVIRWVPRSNQANYVRVFTGDGCWSYVGTIGGKQDLSIGNGCGTNAARHELGHALGLAHEQVRQDRDNFVRVNLDLLSSQWRSQYEIDRGSAGTPIGNYDFESMMHYDNSRVNGRWVFEPKNGFPPDRVGNHNVNTFTSGDLFAIESLYGRPGSQGPSNGRHVLHPRHAPGLALDDLASNTAQNAPIGIWQSNNGANQAWVFNNSGVQPAGHYNLAVSFGPYCLTATGSGNGSAVTLQGCNGSSGQAWRPVASNGAYQFRPANNGNLCLDVSGAGTANGSRVIVWNCSNANNQLWSIQ